MRIAEILPIAVRIPPDPGSPSSRWIAEVGQQILVRARTDEGRIGWGGCFSYCSPRTVYQAVENLAPLVIGFDPSDIEAVAGILERAFARQPRETRWAAAGIELATWDILGKSRGVSVSELLRQGDHPLRASVPVYGSLPRYEHVLDLKKAAAYCVSRGFTDIKLHQTDVSSVAAVREAVGYAVGVMLDGNCAWNFDDAVSMIWRLVPYRLRWLEEPITPHDDYSGLSEIRKRTGLAIACGENDLTEAAFQQAIDHKAADVYQPSLLKVGGLIPMRRIVHLLTTHGCSLAPHSYYPGPGFVASLHLAAACDSVMTLEIAHAPMQADLCATPLEFSRGMVRVPTSPGLGADPNPAVLDAYEIGKDGLTDW